MPAPVTVPDPVTAEWTRTAADRLAVAKGCWFDLAAAERVRAWARRYLQPSKGERANRPIELFDWQWRDIIAPLFGWKRADGSRRFRRAYIEIPKKNSKSFLCSLIGNYLAFGDGENGAEVFAVATTQKQAGQVHDEAINMVEASPALRRVCKVNKNTHTIAHERSRSFFRALSGEMEKKSAEGLNAHGLITDELHVWQGREFWDALRYAGAARRQPLSIAITTAGDDMHSICREQHDYAEQVLAGVIADTAFFAYIRCADEKDDIDDPATWHKANPGLGTIISVEDFAADLAEAKRSTGALAAFKRYRLNIWAVSTNPWLKADEWAACGEDFVPEDLAGLPCWIGLDLSRTFDMTAAVFVFHWRDDEYALLPFFWLPEERVSERGAPMQYRAWAEAGHLETTPGNVIDYSFIEKRLVELCAVYNPQQILYDPRYAEDVTRRVSDAAGVERVAFGQAMVNFCGPTAEFERLVASAKLRHNRNPILTWQAGHVQVYTDCNNNKRPVKPPQNDNRKIDGIVAAIMGLAQAMGVERGQTQSAIDYV